MSRSPNRNHHDLWRWEARTRVLIRGSLHVAVRMRTVSRNIGRVDITVTELMCRHGVTNLQGPEVSWLGWQAGPVTSSGWSCEVPGDGWHDKLSTITVGQSVRLRRRNGARKTTGPRGPTRDDGFGGSACKSGQGMAAAVPLPVGRQDGSKTREEGVR